MNRDIESLFESLDPSGLSVVEVSGVIRYAYPWTSYARLEYREFDHCDSTATHHGRSDPVICEQLLEHVEDPITAVGNLKAPCAPGGMLLMSIAFLIRIHPEPQDWSRFPPDGLKELFECQGLRVEWMRSWGNRPVVRRNFRVWAAYRPWQSPQNEPDVPVVAGAIAHVADVSEAQASAQECGGQ